MTDDTPPPRPPWWKQWWGAFLVLLGLTVAWLLAVPVVIGGRSEARSTAFDLGLIVLCVVLVLGAGAAVLDRDHWKPESPVLSAAVAVARSVLGVVAVISCVGLTLYIAFIVTMVIRGGGH